MHGSGEVKESQQSRSTTKRGDGCGIRRDWPDLNGDLIMHGHMQAWVGKEKNHSPRYVSE